MLHKAGNDVSVVWTPSTLEQAKKQLITHAFPDQQKVGSHGSPNSNPMRRTNYYHVHMQPPPISNSGMDLISG